MLQKDFLAKLDQEKIAEAIDAAERVTSGEIRVHIQPKVHGDIWEVAQRTFVRLGMTKTELRNGVLLFIVCEEQRFVILGDKGIDEMAPAGFWDDIAAKLTIRFRGGEYQEGIIEAIHSAGEELRHDFPWTGDDSNELSNEISIDHH